MNRVTTLILGCLATATAAGSVDGEIEIGTGYLDGADYRYGRYNGLVEDEMAPVINLVLRADNWSLRGANIGRDNLDLELTARSDGHVFRAGVRSTPHYYYDDGLSPFLQVESGQFELPDGWIASGDTTDTMATLQESLDPTTVARKQWRYFVDYEHQISERWHVNAGFERETDTGERLEGLVIGSTGGNSRAALVVTSVDNATTTYHGGLGYSARGFSTRLLYRESRFKNESPATVWRNPFGQHVQWANGVGYPNGYGRLSAVPDTELRQLSLLSNARLSRTTRASLTIARAEMTQDDLFLDYTVNPALDVPIPLPVSGLNGQIDTSTVDLNITSSPWDKVVAVLGYRIDDRNNQSPQIPLLPVRGDSQDQGTEALLNRPYSYREDSFQVSLDYSLSKRISLGSRVERTSVERDFSEVNESTTDEFEVSMRVSAPAGTSLRGQMTHKERDGEPYVGNRPFIEAHPPGEVAENEFVNHPLLRKYYLADATETAFRVELVWPIGERTELGSSAAHRRLEFGDTYFGLNRATTDSVSVFFHHRVRERIRLDAFVAHDRYQQEQSGRSFTVAPGQVDDPNRNWWVSPDDRFLSANFSIEVSPVHVFDFPIDLAFEVDWSNAVSEVAVASGQAFDSVALPDNHTRRRALEFEAGHEFTSGNRFRIFILYERYRRADLHLDDVEPDTMQRVLSTGRANPRFEATWFGMSYIHKLSRTR